MQPTSPSSSSQGLIAPNEMLQDFCCGVCKCLLTVPPIRLIENHYVCGRCPGDGLREMSLERFASQFQFPCRYVQGGCKLNLIWTEVGKHEKACSYKATDCPITNCEWKETKEALVEHMENTHADQVLSAKVSLKLSNIQLAKYFYFIGDETAFEIDIENSEEMIIYKVTALWSKEDPSFYACQISFLNEDFNLTLLHEAKIFGASSQMDKNAIKSLADNFDEIQVHIRIDTLNKIKHLFVECVKCSSPMEKHMWVPQCGHSFCKDCILADYNECPKCTDSFNHRFTVNRTLEKFLDSFKFNLK